MFVGVHALLAAQTQTPELAITEDEGKAFTLAAQNVMRHYSVEATQQTLDWIALAGTCVAIYGTRVAAIQMRKRQERQQRRGAGTVVPFSTVAPVQPQAHDMSDAAHFAAADDHAGE